MGVPKFFRWMSERYPSTSQLIAENRIPEFDCLYLDMNGIIHNCTHKDSDSPTFRMTEDKMFIAIFNYIEHLYATIKPKKIFFMAVDGVAPRAKMNQQRARRFRTALDAENAREKAIKEGAEMPKEDAFDSNCITPGTEFMQKLTLQLKYFINKKISEDTEWQGPEIVLSGHEVPGEGEHKVMEYIRQSKSQPGYDANMRHCLYGLDADLIMLGLLSHDPHFCLLREEVTFGRQSKTKSKELEHQNFYLMHLCIVREYLELEFQELEAPDALGFEFNMERVIDDFILMAFFVGNDFLPNLPHLHINEGALALMFNVYKTVLPKAKGYINEGGVVNLERLSLLLDELSHVEYRFFEHENADASWLKGKQIGREDVMERTKRRGQLIVSPEQQIIYKGIKDYVSSSDAKAKGQSYDLPVTLPARDRKFVEELAEDLHVRFQTVENEQGELHIQLSFPPKSESGSNEGSPEDESSDEEAQLALRRVLKRYDNAKVVAVSSEDARKEAEKKYESKFLEWKNNHYQTKFGWDLTNEEELRKLTENYVQGLQWVLFYYYRGVASWPWFYQYHYAPMISDVKKGLKADMNFKLGQPFRPFQQLMGVLPDRSKTIVPPAYHELMTSQDSPIIDFYPREFELDMNGKKMEWEAVVKIPFIEEDRLLSAMRSVEDQLTEAERSRNDFGVTLKFVYSKDVDFGYPSPLPGIFPDLANCHCVENIFELPTMDGLEVYVGLMDGVKLGKSALAGFPSLKVLPFHGQLGHHGVSVFQQESRNESMITTLQDTISRTNIEYAKQRLGKPVHVGYPFLQEGKVVKVSDELFDYTLPNNQPGGNIIQTPHGQPQISDWQKKAERLENFYSKRLGIITGVVESMIHVQMLKGLIKTDSGATIKEYKDIPGMETDYLTQTVVDEVISEDQRFIERAALPIEKEYPIGCRAFYLGEFAYGRPLEIIAHHGEKAEIWVLTEKNPEPQFGTKIAQDAARNEKYLPSYAVAKMLNLHPLVLSKLTSSFSVMSSGLRLNLGLNLKFEKKKEKVLGYSRKGPSGWEYGPKAVHLLQQYMINFPHFIAGVIANPKGDIYNDTDFYPEEEAKAKMKEIGAWLKSIESKSFERVPLEAEQFDSDVVAAIEQAADAYVTSSPEMAPRKVNNVPRYALLKPSDAEQQVGSQRFKLGDRVVYVQDSGRVPIGQKGTVVGMTRTSRTTLLDVVFDSTFMSGSSLGERCSPFRGSTVPFTTVVNLTDTQLVVYNKKSTQRRGQQQHQQAAQPYTVQSGSYGAPTGPQLHPATAPPALRGSFAGAAGGQNGHQQTLPIHTRGGRGGGYAPRGSTGPPQNNGNGNSNKRGNYVPRGPRTDRGRGGVSQRGGNSGQYVVTDMTDPTAGVHDNPGFKPTAAYNATPPPASLDSSSRGSRGRGRGRGSRGSRGAPRGGSSRGG